MKALLWLFPKRWRERYGEELTELLAAEHHGLRDIADLVAAAALLRLEQTTHRLEGGSEMRIALLLAGILIGVGSAATVLATGQLADGVRDIPNHWWSTLACAPLAVGVALAAISWRLHARRA